MVEKPFRSQLSKTQARISELFEGDHLVGFREDVKDIWIGNRENKSFDVNPSVVSEQIRERPVQMRQRILTIEDGVNKIQVIDGLTGGALGFLVYLILKIVGITSLHSAIPAIGVFVTFTLLSQGILYTKAIVNILYYQEASPRDPVPELLFKRAWNTRVLSSNSSILGITVIAFLRRVSRNGYELGLDNLEKWDKRESLED